jgi:triacylglycerol lipase
MWWLLFALGVLATIAGWLWLRRRARNRGVAPRHPIILVHGIMGFDEIGLLGQRYEYFRGIVRRLEEHGAVVLRPRLPAVASIEERARALVAFIRALEAPKVNIIGHSMGGLDARFAISRLGLAERVASLTTIGTPHHGTPLGELADVALVTLLRRMVRTAGMSVDGLASFSPAQMKRFNVDVPDDKRVRYASVVARLARGAKVHPLLIPVVRFLREENDGLVPSASQRWGETILEVDADHWAQVGWSRRYDAVPLYLDILRHLRRRGF